VTRFTRRRNFLQAIGAAGVVAPFVPSLDREVEAAADGPPKRLLLLFRSLGVIADKFWPTGSDTDFHFPVGGSLEPLADFKDQLIVPRNLLRKQTASNGGHLLAIGSLFTHAKLNSGNQQNGLGWAAGPSVDQILAEALPQETDFQSLQVAAGLHDYGGGEPQPGGYFHVSYRDSNDPLPSEADPRNVYTTLFGNFAPNEEAIALLARRKSAMDIVGEELQDLRKRVGQSDWNKIDRHLEAVRDIERRLEGSLTQCELPDPTFTQSDYLSNDAYPDAIKLQSDLMVQAFACDRTRIASMMWGTAASRLSHNERLGLDTPSLNYHHHYVSHQGSAEENPDGPIWHNAIERWHNEQVAYLLGELRKIPEGDGTMLDNTLVVMAHELNDGNLHVIEAAQPVVLAGNLGGALRTGRSPDYGMNQDWHQMLLTICKGMGVDIEQIGTSGNPGLLPDLLA
jgi:hypothetical protein